MTKTETEDAPQQDEETAVSRLRDEVVHYVGAQLDRAAGMVGQKLTDVTGQLNDVAENGGQLPAIGSRILQGESPVRAFLAEKTKAATSGVADKVKETLGGGRSEGKAGDTKVTNIVEVLDVGVPLRVAYDQWTQYEDFSSFTKGVSSVSRDDETTSKWKAKVGPSTRSFEATIQEQVPDDRIVWTSEGDKGTTHGAVSFHELAPNLTRIVLVVEYYPSGFFEKTGNLWRAQGRRLRLDFKNFQRYVTLTEEEPEGWRGEIRDGEVVRTHEEAMEEEEAEEEDADDEEYDDEAEEDEGEEAEDEDGDEDEEADEEEDDVEDDDVEDDDEEEER
ncbi:SRPBCC family protein [Streptomyces sp. NPDC088729]|uniref:SRPBCC family protein n=1 Tax=Streptomyces sp. NPDC088729 TaxID=3365876 RepID=UPI0037F21317